MKAQAVRRSALFLRLRTWWRDSGPSPYFVAALCAVPMFACCYVLAVVYMAGGL